MMLHPIVPDMPFYGQVLEDKGLLAIDWAKAQQDDAKTLCTYCSSEIVGLYCSGCGRRYLLTVKRYKKLLEMWSTEDWFRIREASKERRERTRTKARHEQ